MKISKRKKSKSVQLSSEKTLLDDHLVLFVYLIAKH